MDPTILSRAETFIWKSARLLDRHLFSYLFRGGSAQPVIHALKAYQNLDGGLGHALEPDNRCPDSQPIFIEHGLYVLEMADALRDPQVQKDLLLPACDFLQSVTTAEGGVPFTLPTANKYPHTPWMEAPENPPASLNPTASITGLLLKSGVKHPWLEQASEYCWREIPRSQKEGYHDLTPQIKFLENAPDPARARVELDRIAAMVRKPSVVEMDPHAGGYVQTPVQWAPTPDSFCRPLFDDDILRLHLSALVERQRSDGGWAITWDPISPLVEAEWRGRFTIDALVTLREYEKVGLV